MPIVQVGKPRHREVQCPPQEYAAGRGWSSDRDPELMPGPRLLAPFCTAPKFRHKIPLEAETGISHRNLLMLSVCVFVGGRFVVYVCVWHCCTIQVVSVD